MSIMSAHTSTHTAALLAMMHNINPSPCLSKHIQLPLFGECTGMVRLNALAVSFSATCTVASPHSPQPLIARPHHHHQLRVAERRALGPGGRDGARQLVALRVQLCEGMC